ncbi:MAG: succinylglutamate desuccinylase/aspartoacylase family protein [Gaiellales bacterium]
MSGVERTLLRFPDAALDGLEIPLTVARGDAGGPHLCLLAGIHGCEYSSIDAVRRFMRELDPGRLRGTVTAAAIANPSSFWGRTPFVSPGDGLNLNRCFPGDPQGSFTHVLAHRLFERLIRPADVLLDLHGGDMVEALEPFSLYDPSAVEDTARQLAVDFGLPYVVRVERSESPVAGTTSGAAAELGIPGVIAEVGGRGLLEADAVALHLTGISNVLRRLGMLPGEPEPATQPQHTVDRFVWLRTSTRGWWRPQVGAGDRVAAGEVLGVVEDLFGEPAERIEAPEDGVILFATTSPAMAEEGLLLGLGAGVRRLG